jgi:hypothetical protein
MENNMTTFRTNTEIIKKWRFFAEKMAHEAGMSLSPRLAEKIGLKMACRAYPAVNQPLKIVLYQITLQVMAEALLDVAI